jgi:WD40 repeat protein
MPTLPRSLFSKKTHIPLVASSASLQSVSSKNTSPRVPLQIFKGHKGRVNCACFYPDENKLVSGSKDETLRIWDRKTGTVEVLQGHASGVQEVDVSRDGKMIVSGSGDNTAIIWNGESGKRMHTLTGHTNWVLSVGFSPNSTKVVSGSEDKTVRVWSVETGKLAFEPIKCRDWAVCVRYSPSGDRIASGGPSSVQIWDSGTGFSILSIDSKVNALAWTLDGTQLIGGRKGNITIWNSHNGDPVRTLNTAYNSWIGTLSLSPDRTHLATRAESEKVAFMFNISTDERVTALEHNSNVRGVAYSPSGKLIVTACEDNKLYLWDSAAPATKDPKTKVSFIHVVYTHRLLPQPKSLTTIQQLPEVAAAPARKIGKGVRFVDSPSDVPVCTSSHSRIFNHEN